MPEAEEITTGRKRDLVLLLFISLFYWLSQNILNPIIAVYLDSLGYGAVVSGYAALSFMVFAIILRLIAGFFTDSLSRRAVLAVGCIMYCLASLLFGFAASIGMFVLLRGFQGGGFSVTNTASSTVCADLAPRGRLTLYMNLFWAVNTTATACAGFIVQALMSANNHRWAFFMSSAMLFAALILSLALRYERGMARPERPARVKRTAAELISGVIEKKSLPAFFVLLIISMAYSAPAAYAFVYSQSLGMSGVAGVYNLVAAAFMFIGNFLVPLIVKKTGYLPPLIVAPLLFAVSMVTLTTGLRAAFYFESACFGLLVGVTFPMLNTLGVAGLPFHRRGAGSGTVLLAMDMGIGLGSYIFGALIDATGFGVSFFLTAACAVTGAALAALLFRRYFREKVL